LIIPLIPIPLVLGVVEFQFVGHLQCMMGKFSIIPLLVLLGAKVAECWLTVIVVVCLTCVAGLFLVMSLSAMGQIGPMAEECSYVVIVLLAELSV